LPFGRCGSALRDTRQISPRSSWGAAFCIEHAHRPAATKTCADRPSYLRQRRPYRPQTHRSEDPQRRRRRNCD
jgi:hypothetical protein